MPKLILLEEQLWYNLTQSWEDKGVYTFPKGIRPKVNIIARLEYEPTYYDSAVYRFNHYSTRTSPRVFLLFGKYIFWNKLSHQIKNSKSIDNFMITLDDFRKKMVRKRV